MKTTMTYQTTKQYQPKGGKPNRSTGCVISEDLTTI